MGRLARAREREQQRKAQGRYEQQLRKLEKDRFAWCPECSFQLFTAGLRRIDYCVRCGWKKEH